MFSNVTYVVYSRSIPSITFYLSMEEVFCVLTAEVFGLLTVVPGGGRGGCYQNIFPNYDIILVHARSKSVMSIQYPRRGIFCSSV